MCTRIRAVSIDSSSQKEMEGVVLFLVFLGEFFIIIFVDCSNLLACFIFFAQ